MPKVEIRNHEIHAGSETIPLVSGEFHYWRHNPSVWKEILARIGEMGLKIVSTYVPWDYHEYQRGHFDFTGQTDPTRNLKGFLELTREEGFKVIIRPGPYIYSEWPNEGAPAYAYKFHRLHPQFQAFAKVYLEKVVKVIKPFLASQKNGHIIMLQADNEIDPWPDVHGYQYGLHGKTGLFQEFIEKLYKGSLRDLNESWGTSYKSFKEAGPFIATMLAGETGLPLKGDTELKRNIDYLKFKYDFSNRVAEWNVKTYTKLGIDVPIYLNLYPFFYAHDWIDLQQRCDMVGLDLYPTNEFSEDRFEQRKFIDKIRYLKSVSSAAYIAEFASGVWHSRHYETGVLTPKHYRLITLSALLGGCTGWNWYMLVNRDNWYMSPINEWGRVRGELYEVFKQVVSIFNKIHPPTLEKITEIAATFNPMQYAARTMPHNSPVLTALYDADIDYAMYDPRMVPTDKKFLFYSGNQWLEASSQKNLRRYIENGGTLIAFRDYPRKDDRFQPSSITGFEEPQSTLFEFKKKFKFRLASGRPEIDMVSSIYSFGNVDGHKITADFGPYGTNTIGYIKKIGKGKIVHLGVEPTPALIMELVDYLKVPLGSRSRTRDVKTAFFKRKDRYYLIAVNNGDEDKSVSVDLFPLKDRQVKMHCLDLSTGEAETLSSERRSVFTFEIPRKDGKVFEFRA